MATADASTSSTSGMGSPAPPAAEVAAKAVHKRYEGLMTVRMKAIKGKGAWYWAHLEPILVQSTDTGLLKAVKLRCILCNAVFSASNPSRTASEHLKRGACPNFTSASAIIAAAKPIASIAPCSPSVQHHHYPNSRKRSSSASTQAAAAAAAQALNSSRASYHHVSQLATAEQAIQPTPHPPPLQQAQPQVLLSGGKDDLGALAILEDSVKRLKSPKASPGPAQSKAQADSALALLSDWLYESIGSGAVSLPSVEHPKFRSFLGQVGLPPVSLHDLLGPRLESRYEEARADGSARIRDALFFQLASNGWKPRDLLGSRSGGNSLVYLTVNLPNGTSVFHRAMLAHSRAPSEYAEEVLMETVADVCGSNVMQRCAGIIADRFKSKALRDLENQYHWMVNLSCQLQGFHSLIKDIAHELPLFQTVAANCYKLASYFNTQSQVRSILLKYQLQELDHACLLRVPSSFGPCSDGKGHCRGMGSRCMQIFGMLEDILWYAQAIQLVVLDESYKLVCLEDLNAKELAEMIQDMGFWNELDAIQSLVKLIKDMVQEMELERPLIGQCLPIWDELRSKVKDWCTKFSIDEGPVKKVIEKRFKKSYHPAWSAAFILDPFYLIKDASGKYLPPFKFLTSEQEKDVDKLITRLVSREEAHIALMELMKWRAEGLDPYYAQAVQVKQLDPLTGKMRIANPQSSRLVWETCLSEFKSLGKVAVRLIFLHATSCSFKCNPLLFRWMSAHGRSRARMDRACKLLFISANTKLERRDFLSEEEKDAELFTDGEDDVVNEIS